MVFGRGRDQQRPDHRAIEAKVDEEMHGLVTQLTNEITFHMRERGITRADLAARMGVSPGRVSQILGGGENLTLRTLAALAGALDARFDFELSSHKVDDTFTSRAKADTEAVQNQHSHTRSQHHQNTFPRR
jgi:transcriptional regulator with XRE-family HTH domain